MTETNLGPEGLLLGLGMVEVIGVIRRPARSIIENVIEYPSRDAELTDDSFQPKYYPSMLSLQRVVPTLAALSGLHAILKFAFFLLPYAKRRDLLDRSYGTRASATARSDDVLLLLAVLFGASLFAYGLDPVSFLGGLWIGATLIQLYFHRFTEKPEPSREESGSSPCESTLTCVTSGSESCACKPTATQLAALFRASKGIPVSAAISGWGSVLPKCGRLARKPLEVRSERAEAAGGEMLQLQVLADALFLSDCLQTWPIAI